MGASSSTRMADPSERGWGLGERKEQGQDRPRRREQREFVHAEESEGS